MVAKVARRDALWKRLFDQRQGGRRQQDLPAMTGCADPGRPMDVHAQVFAVRREPSFSGVDADADLDALGRAPIGCRHGALHHHGRRDSARRAREDGEE